MDCKQNFVLLQEHFSPPEAELLLEEPNGSHCSYFTHVLMKDVTSKGFFSR